MAGYRFKRIFAAALVVVTFCTASTAVAKSKDGQRPVSARLSGGMRIVSVSNHSTSGNLLQTAASSELLTPSEPASQAVLDYPYPQPPLAGFSPLIAITTSNAAASGELEWEHVLRNGYFGSPLNPPATDNYVIGILDSGATVNLIGYCASLTLGVTGSYLTPNKATLACLDGGTTDVPISQPIGVFAAGLGAIQPNGQLDLAQLVGHTNVSVITTNPETCGDGPEIPAVVGTPLLAFFTTVIRNDLPHTVEINGQPVTGPDVQILNPSDPSIPVYPRSIAMLFGGLTPVTTASYLGDFFDFTTPIFPTSLSLSAASLPTGGAFFATINVLQGEPGPTNPIQEMRVLADTGAQSSIISPAMVANLNLDLQNPHFTVEVLGVCGLQQNVGGYYIDYVKINASGGALEFSKAPFVALDLPSIDGGPLDGVLGMNFFWDRNLVFEPSLSGSGFIHVSDPIAFAYGDFNRDLDVDQDDFNFFQGCISGPGVVQSDPSCTHVDTDGDEDVDQEDFGIFQRCLSGPDIPADPTCSL